VNEDEKVESTEVDETKEADEGDSGDTAASTQLEDQRRPYEHPEGTRVIFGDDGKPQDVGDYIGVSPEYMNYANDYDKPILTDKERLQFTDQYDHLVGNADAEDLPADADADEAEVKEQPADLPDDETDGDSDVVAVEFTPAPEEKKDDAAFDF